MERAPDDPASWTVRWLVLLFGGLVAVGCGLFGPLDRVDLPVGIDVTSRSSGGQLPFQPTLRVTAGVRSVLVQGTGVLPCGDVRLEATAFRVPGEVRLAVGWTEGGGCDGPNVSYGYAATVEEIPPGEHLLVVRQKTYRAGDGWELRRVGRMRITVRDGED